MNAPQNLRNDSPWTLDHDHAVHPWVNFGAFEKDGSLVMVKGQGCQLWDASGREYFDAIGGMWCTNVGLGRAEMAQAMADQAMQLAYTNYFCDVTSDTAARLADGSGDGTVVGPRGLRRQRRRRKQRGRRRPRRADRRRHHRGRAQRGGASRRGAHRHRELDVLRQ